MKIHKDSCKNMNDTTQLQISTDGVSESRSTTTVLDVYSFKTIGCQVTYPYMLYRPLGKYKNVDIRAHLGHFLTDMSSQGTIVHFIGDNPKRAFVRDALQHSSLYPCEYCFCKGKKCVVSKKMNALRSKNITLQIKTLEDKIAKESCDKEIKIMKSICI